jgi:N6-L-threonylcarbamoyladenine synthase
MLVLGIESSCDETSVSVIDGDKRNILSNVVLSQVDAHKIYGGVVPEIASRMHSAAIDKVTINALEEAKIDLENIDVIAATCGPGLIGGVIVGATFAKALAYSSKKPFVAVNHMEGHLLTPRLVDDIEFPYLVLLTSGGHTQIVLAKSLGDYKILGNTIDDAAGEAFDKVAKMLGLSYPGGPAIEKLIEKMNGDSEAFNINPPMKGKKNAYFSFSGLKTNVRYLIEKQPELSDKIKADIAASFQKALVESVADRLDYAVNMENVRNHSIKHLVVSGGVAANKMLRSVLQKFAAKKGLKFVAPPFNLCSDNGAMIAWAGYERFTNGLISNLGFKPKPRWSVEEL